MKIIDNILDKIDEETIKEENKEIINSELPQSLVTWVKRYERVGHRNSYVWKLFLKAQKEISYIPIIDDYRKSLEEVGFLLTMFVVLIDDISDKEKSGRVLKEMSTIPFDERDESITKYSEEDVSVVSFANELWDQINVSIRTYPKYEVFKDIFMYDINQTINSINYDYIIIKHPNLINYTESLLYPPHSLKFLSTDSLELMCAPEIGNAEISLVREVSWYIQKLLRIGNWLSTWEREINEDDYTSGIFACAISLGIVSAEDLNTKNKSEIITSIKESNVENILLNEWVKNYNEILGLKNKTNTINIESLVLGLEKILRLEFVSKGYK